MDKELKLSIFPWDNNEKPCFTIKGVKWYLDEVIIQDIKNKGLKNICPYYIKDGKRITRVLIGKENKVLYEGTTIDGIGCFLDIMKADKDFK